MSETTQLLDRCIERIAFVAEVLTPSSTAPVAHAEGACMVLDDVAADLAALKKRLATQG